MPDWFLSTDPGYARVAPASAPGGAFTPVAAFSTRRGGTSAAPWDSLNLSEGVGDRAADVRANRARLLGALGLDPARVAWATQVHGAHVLVARAPGLAGTGDALITTTPDLVLAVGAADCLPVLAWDAGPARARTPGRAVAAAHAGWRGLVAGVIPQTLAAFARLGAPPAELHVALGPRIGPCCFVVGPDVPARFAPPFVGRPSPAGAAGGDADGDADGSRAGHDRATVDLAAVARDQLLGAGVLPGRIHDLGHCTACDPERYFSHRRDRGRTGRAWGVISLAPAGPAQAGESAV
jgi:YfiH family protein